MRSFIYLIFILTFICAGCKKKGSSQGSTNQNTNSSNEKGYWCIYESTKFLKCYYGTSEGAIDECQKLRDAGRFASSEKVTSCDKCKK